MSKRQLLCLLGALIIVFLFLGFPSLWHKVIAVLAGLSIIIISYNLPQDQKRDQIIRGDTFIENRQ
ncbi:MAG: hypothetical protein Q8Q03_01590 [bacterium]|nr:hypothetical protein [bacterium]